MGRRDVERDVKGDEGDRKKRRVRNAIGRRVASVPVLRRWQIRRTLKFIDKSKAKGRRLPPELAETSRHLSQVPKARRAEMLEEAILTNQALPNMGREYRRAASRKRLSTRSDTRYRTGRPPGAAKQGRQRPR